MSAQVIDGIIWLFLFIGVMFCGISIIGLLLFPDIRSRQYTASRASLIGSGAIVSAVIVFGLFRNFTSFGHQYGNLIILTLGLFVVILAGNLILSRMITQRAIPECKCEVPLRKNPDE